jgi:hypothetical protein
MTTLSPALVASLTAAISQCEDDLARLRQGVLTDGTNLIGVSWEGGGQHVARAGPATGWATEERIDPAAPKWSRSIWALVIDALIGAHHDTVAELGEPPR